jgi:hypothetical protein
VDNASEPRAASTPREDMSNVNHPSGIPPKLLKVIQAAASAYLGRRVNITSVKVPSPANKSSSSWEEQGRRIIQTSHNLIQRAH